MRQGIREFSIMWAVSLLLYYLYWCLADGEFLAVFLDEPQYLPLALLSDTVVCAIITALSMLYSLGIMKAMNNYASSQMMLMLHTILLFVLDLLTAWGLNEVGTCVFEEVDTIAKFQNFFLFAILATLISSIKTNSMFWRESMKMERERMEMERKIEEAEHIAAKAQLHTLQSHVNPLFFFNNLSALSSLITNDTKAAKEFILSLASMYRNILMGMKHETVPLKNELQLVREYAQLLRIRHGKTIAITLPEESEIPDGANVPPVSLQHLVENAVKHNVRTQERPLLIRIRCQAGRISVSNNLQPLAYTTHPSGTGHENLRQQLILLGVDGLEKTKDNEQFTITFPLIIS